MSVKKHELIGFASIFDGLKEAFGTFEIQKQNASGKNTGQARIVREERTEKLKETDFYGNSDVSMSSDMTTYRQALRDLPSNYTTSDSSALKPDLSNLNWPTKP